MKKSTIYSITIVFILIFHNSMLNENENQFTDLAKAFETLLYSKDQLSRLIALEKFLMSSPSTSKTLKEALNTYGWDHNPFEKKEALGNLSIFQTALQKYPHEDTALEQLILKHPQEAHQAFKDNINLGPIRNSTKALDDNSLWEIAWWIIAGKENPFTTTIIFKDQDAWKELNLFEYYKKQHGEKAFNEFYKKYGKGKDYKTKL